MTRSLWILPVALVAAPLNADDFKAEEGYGSLFNGKALTGWKYGRGQAPELKDMTGTADKRIEVKDGAIVMNEKDSAGKGGIKDLFTVEEFGKDFHLKLEFRAGLKADSGVYIRGPQLQVRDFPRRNEEKQLTKFKNDDWNELDITVKGKEATCLVNGELLKKMTIPEKGGIGLQAEAGKFEFRHVRIKVME